MLQTRGPSYIKKFDSNGNFVAKFAITKGICDFLSFGFAALKSPQPEGIAIDSKDFIYITDIQNHRVLKIGSKGSLIAIWGKKGVYEGEFDRPSGIAIDSKDNIYVCDTCNDRIQIFKSNGKFISSWKGEWEDDTEFRTPCAIAIDRNDYIYVLEGDFYCDGNNRIQIFDSSGKIIGKTGKKGVFDGEFNRPSGIAVDRDRNIYVADTENCRIQKFRLDLTDFQ